MQTSEENNFSIFSFLVYNNNVAHGFNVYFYFRISGFQKSLCQIKSLETNAVINGFVYTKCTNFLNIAVTKCTLSYNFVLLASE